MKEYAKKYNEIGLSCLPCKQDKSPYLLCPEDTWHRDFGLTEFETAPAIGVKCGKESGGLECIDIDNHQGTAKENLTEFIEQIKDLYEHYKFPIEKTQNGGYHFLYKADNFEGNQKLASVAVYDKTVNKWRPDCIFETRGEGGYFCAYPTPGYTVVKNDIYNIPKITNEERDYIISIAKAFNKFVKKINNPEYEDTDKPGDKYNKTSEAIDEMKDILLNAGWKDLGKGRLARPGKKKGVSGTIGQAAENIFYCFSSNAYPFEPEKGYTPFQVLALVKFNEDFKEAAKYVCEKLGIETKKPTQKQPEQKPEISVDEKISRLQKAFINTEIEIEKPPVILYISDKVNNEVIMKRLFTLGNFSAIIGKAKSRKTFNMTMLTGAMINGYNLYNKFYPKLPQDKQQILYFDTEQGMYDSSNVLKRMERLSKSKADNFAGFNVREYSPLDRCQIVEDALELFPGVGFVAIDGIADLAKAINDEEEATRVTGLLLRWTKQYNCHISTVLHQNKNDNFATGHLGSSVMKKAEIVISVKKEDDFQNSSLVSCDFSRGMDFDPYKFYINDNGLPEISSYDFVEQQPNKWYD